MALTSGIEESGRDRASLSLFNACKANDLPTAETFVHKANISYTKEGWTSLTWGAFHGNFEMVELLASLGACEPYLDQKEPKKFLSRNPLMWAAHNGHLRVFWFLLRKGFSISQIDKLGNTPLHQGAAGGAVEVVRCILSLGGNTAVTNLFGHSPYHLATRPEIKHLLKRAFHAQTQHKPMPALLCFHTDQFYPKDEMIHKVVFAHVEDEKPEQPVCWHFDIAKSTEEIEEKLKFDLSAGHTGAMQMELERGRNLPLDIKLAKRCAEFLKSARIRADLRAAADVQNLHGPQEYLRAIENLEYCLEQAVPYTKDIGQEVMTKAKRKSSQLKNESDLIRLLNKASEINFRLTNIYLSSVDEAIELVEINKNKNMPLLEMARNIIEVLKLERDLRGYAVKVADSMSEYERQVELAEKNAKSEKMRKMGEMARNVEKATYVGNMEGGNFQDEVENGDLINLDGKLDEKFEPTSDQEDTTEKIENNENDATDEEETTKLQKNETIKNTQFEQIIENHENNQQVNKGNIQNINEIENHEKQKYKISENNNSENNNLGNNNIECESPNVSQIETYSSWLQDRSSLSQFLENYQELVDRAERLHINHRMISDSREGIALIQKQLDAIIQKEESAAPKKLKKSKKSGGKKFSKKT